MQNTNDFYFRLFFMKNLAIAVVASTALSGCTLLNETTTPPANTLALRSPVDAHLAIRNTHHHNIIGDYTHREPVDPKPWRELNDALPPAMGG
jgi:hypothetical protein